MSLFELLIIAVGVSMDAFAIAICKGLSVQNAQPKHLIITGLWFGAHKPSCPSWALYWGANSAASSQG